MQDISNGVYYFFNVYKIHFMYPANVNTRGSKTANDFNSFSHKLQLLGQIIY